jgi:hypothetical protein
MSDKNLEKCPNRRFFSKERKKHEKFDNFIKILIKINRR